MITMNMRAKIMLSSGLPTLSILLLVTLMMGRATYEMRIQNAWHHLRDTAELVASTIDADNARAGDTAAMIALAQTGGLFGDRARSLGFLRSVLESTSGITGVYVGYEPNADGADDPTPAPGVNPRAIDAGGRFLPYWFRRADAPDLITLNPKIDMDSSYYYRGLQNLVRGAAEDEGVRLEGGISRLYVEQRASGPVHKLRMITEPYVYEGKFIVEQTSPIIIDGQFKGIAGVDRAIDYIDDFLRELRSFDTAEFILVSKRGRIVYSTKNPELRARRIEEAPYADVLGKLYRDGKIDELTMMDDPLSGEGRIFAGVEIPNGDWRLLLSVSQAEILAPIYRRGFPVLLALVGGVALAVLITALLLRRMISRVEEAAVAVARVASGDLTADIDSSATDESGQILRAIGNMDRSLEVMIGHIKSSTVQLVSAATDINAAALKQRDVSSAFGASTSQIAASTNEITATSRELLETMTQVSNATADTAGVANKGRAELERMESTMQHLTTATGSVSAKLAVISERANNIGAIVTTITRVADQTNLLSLNAAIEAEKAGEYGLGFAVVAREIRRLADQTAVATLDIERIVEEMQDSVNSGVMEMDRFDEEVREGVAEALHLGEHLSLIIDGVETLRPRFEMAQQSMESQVLGAGQINDAMLQLREVAIVSRESSEGLHAASGQLLAAVESLKLEVTRFKTNEE